MDAWHWFVLRHDAAIDLRAGSTLKREPDESSQLVVLDHHRDRAVSGREVRHFSAGRNLGQALCEARTGRRAAVYIGARMQAPIIAALIGASVVMLVNIGLMLYYGGRITRGIEEHERRLNLLELWKENQ
jgi:hypothetical protein